MFLGQVGCDFEAGGLECSWAWRSSADEAAEEAATRRLFGALDWIPVDDAIAERVGRLANRFLPSHPGLDPVDHIIAATAELHDALLWTRNIRHFPMFADLEPPY